MTTTTKPQSNVEQATAVPAVYAAISSVMGHMAKEGISKDRRNSQQGYNFRGIDDVYNTLCGVMAANKLMMLPFVVEKEREERQTKGGGVINYTILTVDFKLVCALDGSSDTVRMIGEAMDSADKSSNKAQSAAMKYAALQVFMIPTESDNDADATTHEVVPKKVQDPKPKADEPKGMPDAEWSRLVKLAEASGTSSQELVAHFKVRNLKHLNQQQYSEAIELLNERLAEKAKNETNRAGQTGEGFVLDDEVIF